MKENDFSQDYSHDINYNYTPCPNSRHPRTEQAFTRIKSVASPPSRRNTIRRPECAPTGTAPSFASPEPSSGTSPNSSSISTPNIDMSPPVTTMPSRHTCAASSGSSSSTSSSSSWSLCECSFVTFSDICFSFLGRFHQSFTKQNV